MSKTISYGYDGGLASASSSEKAAYGLKSAVRILIVMLCILWFVGLEQIFPILPALILFYIVTFVKKNKYSVLLNTNSILLYVFLLLMIVNAINIKESYRIITFTRDFLLYIGATIIFVHFSSFKERNKLTIIQPTMNAFFFLMFMTMVVYIVLPFSFYSFARYTMPDAISNTMLGGRALVKSFGEQLYFYGFTDRVRSFFSSPIHFACIVLLVMPFAIHFKKGVIWKVFVFSLAAAMIFFAQARLFLVMLAMYPVMEIIAKIVLGKRVNILVMVLSITLVLTGIFIAFMYSNELMDWLYELFFERRKGSAENRSAIYHTTWAMIQEHPFWGYGAQIDIPGVEFPAGSHSVFLGIWFKQGFFGFIIILFIFVNSLSKLFLYAWRQKGSESDLATSFLCVFLLYLSAILFNEYIADIGHTYIIFMLLGIINSFNNKIPDTTMPTDKEISNG